MGIDPKLVHQHGREQQNAGGKSERQDVRDFIAVPEAVKKRTRPRP